jgi:tetratricopeptide (TPR) repeat protein
MDDMRVIIGRSDERYRAGDLDGAIAILMPLLDQNVKYFRPYHNVGFFHWLRGDTAKALPPLEKAAQLDPSYAPCHLMLAKAQVAYRRFQAGLDSLDAYAARGGDDPVALQWRARALWGLGRVDAAAAVVNEYARMLGWAAPDEKNLRFSEEPWFLSHMPKWREVLKPILGKVLLALEIGNMEGMSAIWTVENLLSPRGKLEINDIVFRDALETNLSRAGVESRLKRRLGDSGQILPTLAADSYDFIYVDGDHALASVFRDCVNALVLAKTGAFIVLDDYGKANEPTKAGIDHFLAVFGRHVEQVSAGYQIFLRRRPGRIAIDAAAREKLLGRVSAASREALAPLSGDALLRALRRGAAQFG